MNVREALHKLGRTTAREIADATGLRIELVYRALVGMESRGEARVEVTYEKTPSRVLSVEWVSMREMEVA